VEFAAVRFCQAFILSGIVECKASEIPKALLICTEEIWTLIVNKRTLLALSSCAGAVERVCYTIPALES